MNLLSIKLENNTANEQTINNKSKWRITTGYNHSKATISFNRNSYSANINIPSELNSSYSASTKNIGNLSSYDDREYDDGYVRKDFGTETWGDTWYWGYDNSSQINGDTIVFSAYDGTYANAGKSTIASSRHEDVNNDGGFFIQSDFLLSISEHLNYGLLLRLSQSSFSSSQSERQDSDIFAQYIVDTYTLGGVIPPSPPYNGTLAGPGPLIPNTPSSRQTITTQVPDVYYEINESIHIDIISASFGAFIKYSFNYIYMMASAGPMVNFINWNAKRNESLYSSSTILDTWNDNASNNEWNFGLFCQADTGIKIFKYGQIGIFGRYEWIDNLSRSIGPSTFNADFANITYGVNASWQL